MIGLSGVVHAVVKRLAVKATEDKKVVKNAMFISLSTQGGTRALALWVHQRGGGKRGKRDQVS